MTKYPPVKEGDGVLLRLREDYEQAVLDLFEADQEAKEVRPALAVVGHTSNFLDNMKLPVHRWFRFSAGFSAEWAETVIASSGATAVLDPFAGSGTTLLAAERKGIASYGVEAHSFVTRVASAKLQHSTDVDSFVDFARAVRRKAKELPAQVHQYPELIRKCF